MNVDPFDATDDPAPVESDVFPIVGIGASAGGLAAIETLFRAMPPEPRIAFVLVTHLSPDRPSMLPELLQATTTMPVCQIEDGMAVQVGHIYTSAPNKDIEIHGGVLRTVAMQQPRGQQLPINLFFQSLANDQGPNAVAVVLSGSGSDAAEGIRAIKAASGMVIVQDPESAAYDGMPRSALATGAVDCVLLPEDVPSKLVEYSDRTASLRGVVFGEVALREIFHVLRSRTSHDFSKYKHNTICRRLERRMHVHQLEHLDDYIRFLRESDREAEILFSDLLIGVTSFFRDPAVFDVLMSTIAGVIQDRPADVPFRVWVAGCATGEEAYSVAILLHECMEAAVCHSSIQVFATDLDERAIDFARAACYSDSMVAGLDEHRLQKYFTKAENGGLVVKRMIRELVVFAPQNVITDPPFTNLDLLCCRNMLIYFQSELQEKLMSTFQFSLNTDALLLLGPAETIGSKAEQFASVDQKARLYRKLATESTPLPDLASGLAVSLPAITDSAAVKVAAEYRALQFVQAILDKTSTPPCVIVDDACNIVYVHGQTGKFLEPAIGKISINVLDMARPGLRAPLANALRHIAVDRRNISCGVIDVGFNEERVRVTVNLTSVFEHGASKGMVMIQFDEDGTSVADRTTAKPISPSTSNSVAELQDELQDCRKSLDMMTEEMQVSNEELRSANEELQSTNEELQSTNEELETSKEELQSLNEESTTVNAELQSRVDKLSKASDDMKNLLDSTDIATVFLDIDLQIRGFTPRAVDLIPLSKNDIGRPIDNLATHLVDLNANLREFSALVLEDLVVREMEVQSTQQRVYLLKARPYRTMANMIDGVVLTFENVTQLKQAEHLVADLAVKSSEAKLLSVMRVCRNGVVLADPSGNITGVNTAFCEFLGYSESELLGMNVRDISDADFVEMTESQLQLAREANFQLVPATFEKKYVGKNGVVVGGRVTTTWHTEAHTLKPLYSIAFVQPLAEADIE